jgi:hypothetical protein
MTVKTANARQTDKFMVRWVEFGEGCPVSCEKRFFLNEAAMDFVKVLEDRDDVGNIEVFSRK